MDLSVATKSLVTNISTSIFSDFYAEIKQPKRPCQSFYQPYTKKITHRIKRIDSDKFNRSLTYPNKLYA